MFRYKHDSGNYECDYDGLNYDMAPGVESPTLQQQLLSLCRACVKVAKLNNCCQAEAKVVLETRAVRAWRSKHTSKWIVVSRVVSRVIVLGSLG